MPAIVRDLDDDAAIILMVDANLQRETILPSERAFSFQNQNKSALLTKQRAKRSLLFLYLKIRSTRCLLLAEMKLISE